MATTLCSPLYTGHHTVIATPTMSSNSNRRSFFGSIKQKISRRPSNGSQLSNSSRGRSPTQSSVAPADAAKNAPPPTNEAPPPYSELSADGPSRRRDPSLTPSRLTQGSRIQAQDVSTPDDQFAFLSTFDTIFLVDDSGSMIGQRWREVDTFLRSITPVCTAHDTDGIDVYFLNHKSSDRGDAAHGRAGSGYKITDAVQVEGLFRRVYPCATTPTGRRLADILNPYMRYFKSRVDACDGDPWETDVKPINVIVITDGQPTDNPEDVLLDVARRLDRLGAPAYQVGVQFFQVGDDPAATSALRHLDDELGPSNGVRDMIDTVSWNARDAGQKTLTAEAVLKTVLGAVKRHVDRQDVSVGEPSTSGRGLLGSRRY